MLPCIYIVDKENYNNEKRKIYKVKHMLCYARKYIHINLYVMHVYL